MVSDTPRLDAELLMAHAIGVARGDMLLRHLDATTPVEFAGLVERRMGHEPVAYITGTRDFWAIILSVGPGVLIPRPDSETLIEAAIGHFGTHVGVCAPATVLDLGTGSGALLLAALDHWSDACGVGIDASAAALATARANADRLGLGGRATFRSGGWDGTGAAFDLILCNPPYVEAGAKLAREVRDWEPAAALFAGADGLDEYRAIAPVLRAQMAVGGVAAVEIGAGQAASAGALFEQAGFTVAVRRDLGGRDRVLVLT